MIYFLLCYRVSELSNRRYERSRPSISLIVPLTLNNFSINIACGICFSLALSLWQCFYFSTSVPRVFSSLIIPAYRAPHLHFIVSQQFILPSYSSLSAYPLFILFITVPARSRFPLWLSFLPALLSVSFPCSAAPPRLTFFWVRLVSPLLPLSHFHCFSSLRAILFSPSPSLPLSHFFLPLYHCSL